MYLRPPRVRMSERHYVFDPSPLSMAGNQGVSIFSKWAKQAPGKLDSKAPVIPQRFPNRDGLGECT